MSEPTSSNVEPVLAGEQPIGESGAVAPDEVTEPTVEVESEPESNEVSADETLEEGTEAKTEVDEGAGETFTDLKKVPDELKAIAKKMQGDYTRRMQKLAEKERELSQPAPQPMQDVPEDEATIAMKQFLSTPEGAALKSLMKEEIAQEYGINDLRQTVTMEQANKEIDATIARFGKEAIEENYDDIVEMMNRYPAAPLDMIASAVLFDSAKESGKAEVMSKFQQKKESSIGAGKTSPVIQAQSRVESFDDAFKAAERSAGLKD